MPQMDTIKGTDSQYRVFSIKIIQISVYLHLYVRLNSVPKLTISSVIICFLLPDGTRHYNHTIVWIKISS